MVANFIVMAVIAWQLVAGGQNEGLRCHWRQYQSAMAMIAVLSILKLDSFQLMYAKITCVRETTSAPIPDAEKSRIVLYGGVGTILEDLPQFVLLMLVYKHNQQEFTFYLILVSVLTVISMHFSACTRLFA